MRRTTSSLSYHMVSEWRPVFHLAEMLSAGDRQKPHARLLAKTSLEGSLLAVITRLGHALTQNWIRWTKKMTWQWRKKRKKGNCPEWPRFTTFWRCGMATKTYVPPRRNVTLKTSRWPPWDTFRTWKRSSKHCCEFLNMMVRLHSYCQKDLLCHHICLQRTSLEEELNY